jgi:hypothetical protein
LLHVQAPLHANCSGRGLSSADTDTIESIAGNGSSLDSGDGGLATAAGLGGPDGIAVDSVGNIYITNGGDRVREVDGSTGIISTIAGAGGSYHSGDGGPAVLAQLDQPSSVAIDREGNIFIAARGENRIRKIDARTGIITTVAGSGEGQNTGVMSIVVYPGGFSGDGGPALATEISTPSALAVSSQGSVYFGDLFNQVVRC